MNDPTERQRTETILEQLSSREPLKGRGQKAKSIDEARRQLHAELKKLPKPDHASRVHATEDAVAHCREVFVRFGFTDLDERCMRQAVADAVQRCLKMLVRKDEVSRIHYDPTSEVHRMLTTREFLKVLCATVYLIPVADALLAQYYGKPNKRLLNKLKALLSPKRGVKDEGSYFDPRCWTPQAYVKSNQYEPHLFLGYFIEGMREQEQGFASAGATVIDAARLVVRKRNAAMEHAQEIVIIPFERCRGGMDEIGVGEKKMEVPEAKLFATARRVFKKPKTPREKPQELFGVPLERRSGGKKSTHAPGRRHH